MLRFLSNETFWKPYSVSAPIVAGFATAAALLIGLLTLVAVWYQAGSNSKAEREATALKSHMDYMRMCFDNPQFASSYMMARHLGLNDFSGIFDELNVESERALWFLSFALFAMQQLLVNNTRWWFWVQRPWRITVEEQLGYHKDLLEVVWPSWKRMYKRRMCRTVKRVLVTKSSPPWFDVGRTHTRCVD